MSVKVEEASRLDVIDRLEALPAKARAAEDAVAAWAATARRFTRRNPGTVLVGAFVVGVLLAKAARHA
jgi:hypothetical protein